MRNQRKSKHVGTAAAQRRQHRVRRKPRGYPVIDREHRLAAIVRVCTAVPREWKAILIAARSMADTALTLGRAYDVMNWLLRVEKVMRKLPPLPQLPHETFKSTLTFQKTDEAEISSIIRSATALRNQVWSQAQTTWRVVQRLREGMDEISPMFLQMMLDAHLMLGVAVLGVVGQHGVSLSKAKLYELLGDVAEAAGVERFPGDLTRWKARLPAIRELSAVLKIKLVAPVEAYEFDEEQYLSK